MTILVPTFTLPLTDSDRSTAIAILRTGGSLTIGLTSLHSECDAGVIWGCDGYGRDFIVASGGAGEDALFARALDCATRLEHEATTAAAAPHPAEFVYR